VTGLKTRQLYRARFAQALPYRAATSASIGVLPRARLTRTTSWATRYRYTTYYARGYIEPAHALSDPNKVKVLAYKKGSDGKYRYVRSFTASYRYHSRAKTAYQAAVRFTSKGTWKLVAYHAADSRNATSIGVGDVFTVK